MSDLVELKPCPFCGGPAEIVDIDEGENAGGSCVCCTSCLASGNVEFEFKENFVSNWNRRATDPELSRLSALVAWQDIETAPKTGEIVDLWCQSPSGGISGGPERVPNCWFYQGYWWTRDEQYGDEFNRRSIHGATHWLPLPAPPVLTTPPVPPTKGPEELAEIERMLNEGQGDDDGMQIMPDFDEGMSTLAKVETCLHLLEKRRDVIAAYVADENWRDDPSADERWNAGLDFGMSKLCAYLGVDPAAVTWDAATETLDGDVCAVIGNILRAKYGDDWGPLSRIATKGQDDDLRAALEVAIQSTCDHASEHYKGDVALKIKRELLLALRSRPASALPVVGVKALEWYPDPGAFPYNTWGAQSSFGRFIIEEVSASDSPSYEARYTPHHLITIKDSLEDAKAAAQADYERRILSALTPSVQP